MKESDLYEQIAQYMNYKHPGVIYHFDLSGVWTPSRAARNLYGRLNKRAWPDLFIAKPAGQFLKTNQVILGEHYKAGTAVLFAGLYIEIKVKSPFLKDGLTLKADEHVREQALVLESLIQRGYKAVFGTGYDQCVQIIDEYLG